MHGSKFGEDIRGSQTMFPDWQVMQVIENVALLYAHFRNLCW